MINGWERGEKDWGKQEQNPTLTVNRPAGEKNNILRSKSKRGKKISMGEIPNTHSVLPEGSKEDTNAGRVNIVHTSSSQSFIKKIALCLDLIIVNIKGEWMSGKPPRRLTKGGSLKKNLKKCQWGLN